jgi:hypothetical protein
MNTLKCSLLLGLLLIFGGSLVMADRVDHAEEVVPADDYEALEVDLDFGAGTIDIEVADMDEPAKFDIYYSPRYVDYEFDFEKRGKTCRLFLESDLRDHDWDHDDIDNEWILQLSTKYRTSLNMDIGACEARLELGGIPLEDVEIDVGAADMQIDFSDPNPERMRELNIDCGASSLEISGLANANAEMMDFDIGAGSCEIDFRGDYQGETEVDIDVGVGSMDVIVPKGVAIMVRGDDDWFSSLDFHGLRLRETRNGIWKSEDFDDAEDRIVFTIDVAMGSVDIRARR